MDSYLGVTVYDIIIFTGLVVTGNETSLVVGISRDLTCTANNIDVGTIEWKIVIAGFEPTLRSASSENQLTIQPLPFQIGQQMYKCVVVSTTGERFTADALIEIQRKLMIAKTAQSAFVGIYLELMHTIEVTSSSTSAVPAGGVVTLTCEVVSNAPTQLTWTGPNGPVTSGGGVSIITDPVDQQTTHSTLAFHPLLVSHAGQYTCRSTLAGIPSVEEANMIVSVQGKGDEPSTLSRLTSDSNTVYYN